MLFSVKREGNQLKAQLTGQPFADIYPESETKFFWKIVDAQVEFTAGAGGATEKATIFQYGQVLPMPRIDSAVAEQMNADLAAKLANQTPTPGGEAAIRRLSEGMASGKPNYDEMSPMLAEAAKKQLPTSQPLIAGLGASEIPHLPERLRPGTGCVPCHLRERDDGMADRAGSGRQDRERDGDTGLLNGGTRALTPPAPLQQGPVVCAFE